jgi:hypothetical protein
MLLACDPAWKIDPQSGVKVRRRLTACGLIDDGGDVYGIGSGTLDDSITKDQISRILPFG